MSQGLILSIFSQTIYQILLYSIPLLGAAMIIGLIISILQATTSIQEQTLTFVPKMIVILILLIILGPFYVNNILDFIRRLFDLMVQTRL